jgi:hypothetical protein
MLLIPGDYRILYEIIALLSLFSHAMELRSRMLCEEIPCVQEVFRQWQILTRKHKRSLFVDEILNTVTAHFLSRLR